MINRLRWKMTAFNTLITGGILLCMTLLCLYVSEKDTRERQYQILSNHLLSAAAYMNGQDRISVSWLREMEHAGQIYICIRDGGSALFSMGLSTDHVQLESTFQQLRDQAKEEYHLDAAQGRGGGSCVVSLKDAGGRGYLGGLSLIGKEGSLLELAMLYPLDGMKQGIWRQRVVVCLGEVCALILLWVFSWYFTGKMLRPIDESHQRQVRFTAAASHELRTPLAAILSAASAMERAEPRQREQFSNIIQREGQRMTRLIGDLLTLASADSQNWQIHLEAVEADMLLLGIYEAQLPRAKEMGLRLELVFPEENIPMACLDRDRIVQVLTILLDNAFAYTPSPGLVELRLTCRRNALRFTVSDTGPGVPDGEKKRIFERFYRGEEARSDRKHFGLGLCIAGEIVRLHGGKLWVEDGSLGGAAFILELPIRDQAERLNKGVCSG